MVLYLVALEAPECHRLGVRSDVLGFSANTCVHLSNYTTNCHKQLHTEHTGDE